MPKRIRFHVGGPGFHPVAEQARQILEWLGPDYVGELVEDAAALENLDDVDLLVVMGLFWTGSPQAAFAGNPPYHPPSAAQRAGFEAYVRSGRPVLAHHGGIASYDDWPGFGNLLGFAWIWGTTAHSELADWRIETLDTGHPTVAGVPGFGIFDELYFDVKIAQGLNPAVHAEAEYEGRRLPMVMTAKGGRVEGAGKTMWLANGHNMRAFESPELKQIWINSVRWLTQD
ncbi:MAG: ThuA domain-containing protein [Phycisphaerae bacterium]